MGLCKCPWKKVTQQFCFEHKVNVCEYCIVNAHQKCIIHPYIEWLEDSSYRTICNLCQQDLETDDCIRLTCYHIFHWKCLNSYASNLPVNTAPAGYTCPDCHRIIFPSSEKNSPVSDELRKILSTSQWSRAGLGLPFIDSNSRSFNDLNTVQIVHEPAKNSNSTIPVSVKHFDNYVNESDISFVSSTRKTNNQNGFVSHSSGSIETSFVDIDDDKYRRKSAMEFLYRWFRQYRLSSRKSKPSYRRWIIMVVIAMIALFTLIHYFLKLGRENADNDPLLDPHFNPNIRIENH